jgi:hypothetical protein
MSLLAMKITIYHQTFHVVNLIPLSTTSQLVYNFSLNTSNSVSNHILVFRISSLCFVNSAIADMPGCIR